MHSNKAESLSRTRASHNKCEPGLFIIWETARRLQSEILENLAARSRQRGIVFHESPVSLSQNLATARKRVSSALQQSWASLRSIYYVVRDTILNFTHGFRQSGDQSETAVSAINHYAYWRTDRQYRTEVTAQWNSNEKSPD